MDPAKLQQLQHQYCLEACQEVSKAYRDELAHLRKSAHKLTAAAQAKYMPRLNALRRVENALVMNNPNATTFHIPGPVEPSSEPE